MREQLDALLVLIVGSSPRLPKLLAAVTLILNLDHSKASVLTVVVRITCIFVRSVVSGVHVVCRVCVVVVVGV